MKSHLSLALFLVLSISITAQNDGWHLYTKASEITKILPDDVNTNELHLATDIGYIKYNTTSNTVTDFLNLTSQNPGIVNVKDIALDPTSNDIALTLKDGIAIYDGLAVSVYSYDNSNLTIGEFTNQFFYLQVEYAKDGSLYIFKEDAFGFQKFNSGVFDTEVTTSFQPQDIIENNAGTKAYFAGANNGLWELEKSTTTWTNYTLSNSNLTNNFLTSFAVDTNDDLYIGHYQGLDKLASNGSFSNCNATSPMAVFEISFSPVNDDILVKTSAPSLSYNGLSIVDYDLCTWTNYKEDGTNCLDENVYTSCSYAGNGLVYAAPIVFSPIPDIGKLLEFSPSAVSCMEVNINYLNAPVAVNSNVVSDFRIREKANGNLEMGFTRTFDMHMIEIDPTTFNGSFPVATTITPYPGNSVYSIINDNNYFIVETNEGWIFIDENNISTTFNHNIPDYLAFVTKKAANYDSENGIINIVHKGFDAAFNIRVYKTQCNTVTGTCATSEEIFTTNRDLTQNVLFGVSETSSSENIHTVGISLDTSVSGISNNDNAQLNSNLLYNEEFWNKNTNGPVGVKSFTLSDILFPNKDPLILRTNQDVINSVLLLSDSKTIRTLTENQTSNEIISRDFSIDQDNDGVPDEIINSFVVTTFAYSASGNPVLVSLVKNNSGTHVFYSVLTVDNSGDLIMDHVMEQQGPVSNNASGNLTVRKTLFVEESTQTSSRLQNNHTATMAMLTNYGLLIKTDVDLSQLTLSTEEAIVQQNELLMYPNPSSNMVSFSGDVIASAAIYDSNGRHIKDVKSSRFSIKELAKGVYILKAKTNAGATITRKLIKN